MPVRPTMAAAGERPDNAVVTFRAREAQSEAEMKLMRRLRRDPSRESDFRRLYERYAPATFAFFLRKVGDPAAAADLNQDLYLRLSGSVGKFEGRCSPRTWIFLLARNALAESRSRRWWHLADRSVTLDEQKLRHDVRLSVDADEAARQVLLRERLAACLRRLSERARAVVIGHYFEGVALRELTERLNLDNPSGSRAVLIGAQRKLRRCLENWGKP